MKHAKTLLVALVLLCAAACDDKPPPTPAFVFNRPNQLELVCLNPGGDAENTDDNATPFVLPFRCCAGRPALAPTAFFEDREQRDELCGANTTPVLHALITQSARGEVAAVNLADEEVLDADQLIPGATFIDVGGLPRAIVVPQEVLTIDNEVRGSYWTYVASGEERAVRAVPTCRFQPSGELCNTSDADDNTSDAGAGAQNGEELLRVPLPAAPSDMVFLAGALWVSLPDAGVIARIMLAKPTKRNGSYPAFGEGPDRVTYFSVPVVGNVDPGAPVQEDVRYQSACGAGYDVSFDDPLLLPSAPVVVASGERAEPSRMRIDGETGLLFVADRAQPVVHAFRVDEMGVPLTAGLARTGAPIRDFAMTRPVPSAAPPLDDSPPLDDNMTIPGVFASFVPTVDGKGKDAKRVPTFGPNERRYMYAIDDRDGSIMALALEVDEGTQAVSTTLLSVPTPMPYASGRSDRLGLFGVGAGVATALDIIDTRLINGSYACNLQDVEGLDQRIDEVDAALDEASDAADAAEKRDALDRELNKLLLLREAATDNGGKFLRGVFLAVADTMGVLSIFDIHDTDLFCRAKEWCDPDDLSKRSTDTKADPPAVRRHALRRGLVPKRTGTASLSGAFVALQEDCLDNNMSKAVRGKVPLIRARRDGKDEPIVCVANDPWTPTLSAFAIEYQGDFFTSTAGALENRDGNETLRTLRAPPGLDLCGRGVVSAELGKADGYEGDWLVLIGEPTGDGCTMPEVGREPRMLVLDAYADHLVLGEPKVPASASIDDIELTDYQGGWAELLKCYPDAIAYQLRLNDRFYVTDGTYLHNVKSSDVDGRCVIDEDRDPILTSRAQRGVLFQNPFLSFVLDPDAKASSLQATIQITGNPEPLLRSIYAGTQERSDSLPVLVRYSEATGDLMVLDSSSQGLRRFLLTELEADGAVYR